MKASNNPLPFSELHNIALREARKIDKSRVEHACVIDEYGNIVRFTGSADSVYIDDYAFVTAKIIVHNHPHEFNEPSSFSGDDVYNLIHYSLKEIIVCGYGFFFCMSKDSCSSLALTVKRDIDRIYCSVVNNRRKIYETSTGTDINEIKHNYREMLIQIERDFHKELTLFTSGKGLSYERLKL